MSDNLARILEQDYSEYHRRIAERNARKARQKKMDKIRTVMALCVVFTLAFTLITRYMKINEQEKYLSGMETSLANLKNTNDQKQILLESAMTLEEIEREAKLRLGMNKPANNQIVYISVQKEDASHVHTLE